MAHLNKALNVSTKAVHYLEQVAEVKYKTFRTLFSKISIDQRLNSFNLEAKSYYYLVQHVKCYHSDCIGPLLT